MRRQGNFQLDKVKLSISVYFITLKDALSKSATRARRDTSETSAPAGERIIPTRNNEATPLTKKMRKKQNIRYCVNENGAVNSNTHQAFLQALTTFTRTINDFQAEDFSKMRRACLECMTDGGDTTAKPVDTDVSPSTLAPTGSIRLSTNERKKNGKNRGRYQPANSRTHKLSQ